MAAIPRRRLLLRRCCSSSPSSSARAAADAAGAGRRHHGAGAVRRASRDCARRARDSVSTAARVAQWALWVGARRAVRLRRLLSLQPAGRAARRPRPPSTRRRSRVVALALATVARHPARHRHRQPRAVAVAALVRGASLVCLSMPPLLTSLAARLRGRAHGLVAGRRDDVGRRASTCAGRRGWLDVAWHLPLPALALALPIAATFERLQSQSMGEACTSRSCWRRRRAASPPRASGAAPCLAGSLRPICARLRHRHRRAALGLVRRRVRHGMAGARPADVRGAARARHLPGGRLRGAGAALPRARHARRATCCWRRRIRGCARAASRETRVGRRRCSAWSCAPARCWRPGWRRTRRTGASPICSTRRPRASTLSTATACARRYIYPLRLVSRLERRFEEDRRRPIRAALVQRRPPRDGRAGGAARRCSCSAPTASGATSSRALLHGARIVAGARRCVATLARRCSARSSAAWPATPAAGSTIVLSRVIGASCWCSRRSTWRWRSGR